MAEAHISETAASDNGVANRETLFLDAYRKVTQIRGVCYALGCVEDCLGNFTGSGATAEMQALNHLLLQLSNYSDDLLVVMNALEDRGVAQ